MLSRRLQRRKLTLAAALLLAAPGACNVGSAEAEDPEGRARRILEALPGTWRFKLGKKTTGTRVVEHLYPGSVVKWSETFDGRDVGGNGFLGHVPGRKLFFSMTVHNVAGEYGVMTGRIKPNEDTIVFETTHLPEDADPFKAVFRMSGRQHFTYTAFVKGDDGEWSTAWVATFKRQGAPASPAT